MARTRSIKPEFWTDPAIIECSLNARLLFIGLLNFADDQGNIEAHEKMIKLQVFPGDAVKVGPLLKNLAENDLIIPYGVNGRNYYHIRSFDKHQTVNHPSAPRYPLYEPSMRTTGGLPEDSARDEMRGGEEGGDKKRGKEPLALFKKFWIAYPKKKSKGQAEKAWAKINPSEQLLETMLSKIETAKTSKEWAKDNGEFIPHPATWLNAKGWEDEYTPVNPDDLEGEEKKTAEDVERKRRIKERKDILLKGEKP